jgi:hypothetical protein
MSQTNKSDNSKRKKKVFKNFAEYWHFVKTLSEDQRRLIVNSLSTQEQKALRKSYEHGGWEDLFMRNACDYILSQISQQYEYDGKPLDLLELRYRILSGDVYLMQRALWRHINSCFDRIPWQHIAYIFDGIMAEEHEGGYVKLSRYVTPKE